MTEPFADATVRNRQPIVEELQKLLKHSTKVLEIGSGTGQHAIWFAPRLPWLIWLSSDLPNQLPGIKKWYKDFPSENLAPPIALNVSERWAITEHDAIFSANTTHIMHMNDVKNMITNGARSLPSKGLFCLYGPFIFENSWLTESNRIFHRKLQDLDRHMGLRKFGDLNELAIAGSMELIGIKPMPANNHLIVWQKSVKHSIRKDIAKYP